MVITGRRLGQIPTSVTGIPWPGEVEVFADGNHLVMRSPDGLYKAGVQLHPVDVTDPLVFEIAILDNVQKVVFKRNAARFH